MRDYNDGAKWWMVYLVWLACGFITVLLFRVIAILKDILVVLGG